MKKAGNNTMEPSNGNLQVRNLLKKLKENDWIFDLIALAAMLFALCILPRTVLANRAYAKTENSLVTTNTSFEVSTTEKKEATTTTFTTTKKGEETTALTTTIITSEATVENTTVVSTESIEEKKEEVVDKGVVEVYEEPKSEPQQESKPESEQPVQETPVTRKVFEDTEVRTRPEITSGQEILASMMAIEGGSSDVTCIRTAIGFMNRIHNSQFMCGSIENVSGYCFSTPNEHHIELATQVIDAYNRSDSSWYDYCNEYNLTDKTVYHHNGTTSQWFEQPGGYVEYGDTGWYSWTLLYSEGIYDHY